MTTKKILYKRIVILLVSLITVPISTYVSTKINPVFNYEFKEENFTEENLISYLKIIRVKFPHIVLAQAKLESGNYTSFIFKNNYNLFGMRHPVVRATTSLGSRSGFAHYNNWKECVIDYALYSSKFIPDISSEDDYFLFLDRYYAQDLNYSSKLKSIIKINKLKENFY